MTQFDQRYQQVETQYNADHITIEQQPLSLTEKQRKQNRARMLQRVQTIWIDGVLEPSLQGAAQIALDLQNKLSAIVTPLWHVLREFDTTGQVSSEHASIVQVYDHANGEVLILGEPGSGKTTLLLELARDLLQRAREDETHPMPVIFPLSTWATKRQPLTTWLASELHSRYQVPLQLATSWIETEQVLPLLDGLDEVAAPQRKACVEAINVYRQGHGLIPTVVCSRQTDYFALTTRLLLRTAVVVQPLTTEQIASYLSSGGERLDALRELLRRDADLQVLASTPLMLYVLTVACQETSPQQMTTTGSLGMKQKQVFASYVQRMLMRRHTGIRYTSEQTMHWLSSLAGQMKRQSQTVFYIEQMQPDWLSDYRMLRVYDCLAVRLPGVLMGMLVSLMLSFISFRDYSELSLLIPYMLLGGLFGGLLSEGRTPQRPTAHGGKARSTLGARLLQWFLSGALIGIGSGLINGKIFGLSFGIGSILIQFLLRKNSTAQARSRTSPPVRGMAWQSLIRRREVHNGLLAGLIIGLSIGLSYGLRHGLSTGLGYGLGYGLLVGLSAWSLSILLIGRSTAVQPMDLLVWSWRSLGKSLFSKSHASTTLSVTAFIGLIIGLGYGQSNGLGYGQSNGLSAALLIGLSAALSNGLLIGLTYWLLLGLFQGVSGATIEDQQRVVPNQGIRRSALNGLLLGLISVVIVGLSVGLSAGLRIELLTGLGFGLSAGLGFGLLTALPAGLLVGLLMGDLASFRHYVVRFLLRRTGSVPWRYARFLDAAAERVLLRKVGGGYIFLHRLLLDYFADLETSSDPQVLAEGRQEVLPPGIVSAPSVESTRADEHVDVPTVPLIHPAMFAEAPHLLPCGHEQRTLNAHFCSVCGQPVHSSSLE